MDGMNSSLNLAVSMIFAYFPVGNRFHGKTMDTDIMTVKEIAAYLKLTEKTAYRLAAEGKTPGFKVGGSWRFKRSEIENWIEGAMNRKARKR